MPKSKTEKRQQALVMRTRDLFDLEKKYPNPADRETARKRIEAEIEHIKAKLSQ